ncbi:TRAP transporter small permease [Anaerotignum sp.]|uniref:TRAP transporter small permease n=1 Tax=Anaerotignum sp. TaxID=2039241 RepID=UPI0028A6EBB6|nr:TRAP transporter small permease [Anaerotignum sp.]
MERKLSKLSKFFDIIDKLEDCLVAVALIGLFSTIILQISGRILRHPFPWTEETTRYLFLWMMFIALAAGFNKAESSRVTILVEYLPSIFKKLSFFLYIVVVSGFFIFMVVYGIQLVNQQVMMKEMGTALLIPMYLIGICVPISGALGLIGTLQSILEYRDNVVIRERKKTN